VRTALLGGSFNPIHFGHLLLALDVQEAVGLDRVVFVPAGVPPHKRAGTMAPAADRFAMVELAIAGHPGFEVSDIELRRSGPSYTVDTVAALHDPGHELFLILGSEMFLDLLSWREPRRIAELARLCIVPRAGSAFDPDGPGAQGVLRALGLRAFARPGGIALTEPRTALLVHATSLPVSASDLRRRVREGRSLAYRVPDLVAAYIGAHDLYRDGASTDDDAARARDDGGARPDVIDARLPSARGQRGR
jgi:nicotinate-nucleotide adenylyltransferase